MTKQYLVLPEWLQPGVAYWICEHSNGPKPNRCQQCDFTDADRGRALEVAPAHEPECEPIRQLIEHIDKVGHIYSYEPIFERARDVFIKRADAPCNAVSAPHPSSARCLNCGWLVGNHNAQHQNRTEKP